MKGSISREIISRKVRMIWAVHFLFFTASAQIIQLPQSASVLLGRNTTFSCAGNASGIFWFFNEINTNVLDIKPTHDQQGAVQISNLTITGSVQNNNATIQCWIVLSNASVIKSAPALLTVLGIGQVSLIELVDPVQSNRVRRSFPFNPEPNPSLFIQWKKPMFVSSDVTDLTFNVSIIGADLTPFDVTTNETECCHDMLFACQMYSITVTPFSTSSNYVGASNGTEDAIDGGVYRLKDSSCKLSGVEFMDADNVTCSFVCKVEVPPTPCPAQCLQMLTTTDNNEHFNETSIVYFVTPKTSVMINVTGLPAGEHYHSNFSIIDHKAGVVDKGEESVSFSTHSVQDAAFSHLLSASVVNVTCYFATNAFASACMARFENASLGLAFNGTVDHPHGLLNSSGNVTIPREVFQQGEGRVAFDVKVFDVHENGSIIEKPAFEKTGALEVVVNDAEPIPDTSTHATGASTSAIPSSSPTGKPIVAIITSLAVVSVLIVLMVIPVLVAVRFCFLRKKKRCTYDLPVRMSHHAITKDSHGAEESGPDADLPTVGGGEETLPSAHTRTPSHTYSSVKRPEPKPTDTYEVVQPIPLNTQSSPFELVGEKAEQVQSKKDSVMYAELGSRPVNAPPVLPPDTIVHYMTVQEKPIPKDMGSHRAEGSDPDVDHARFVCGEEIPHPQQSAPTSCYPHPTVKQPRPNPRDAQYEKVDSNPSNAQSSPQTKKGGVMYAELGPKPANAPPVLPPDTRVNYTTVKKKPLIPKDTDSCGTEGSRPDSVDLITFSESGDSPHPLKSPAPSFTFSPEKKQPKPNTGIFQYETVHPQPSIAQSSPHQLGGKKAEHIQSRKGGVMYAELGTRPANAPPVLPPDRRVHYITVRKEPMPKDTSFHGSSTSVDMRATVSSSNASIGSGTTGVVPLPRVDKQSHEKEGKSATFPYLVDKQSQEKEGAIHAHEEWEEEPELEAVHVFHDKGAYTTTGMPEFGQHRAIVTVRGEPSGLRAAGAAGQNFTQMVFTSNYLHVPEESKDTAVSLISPSFSYMSKAAVGGICSETDENTNLYLTIPIQESGLEQLCELVIVEGEHYQKEALLEKPCLDERKMTWEFTEQSILSYEQHRNSSSFSCALGDQNPWMCIPQEESSSEKPCQNEHKVTQKLTERTVLSYQRRQNSTFCGFALGNQYLGIPQDESLPEKPCQDEFKMTQKLIVKNFLSKRRQKYLFFTCTLGSRNPSTSQEESLSVKACQDEYKMTQKLTEKTFLRNMHQKSLFFASTLGNRNPSIPQGGSSSEKCLPDEYKTTRRLTGKSFLSNRHQKSSFFGYTFGNRNPGIPQKESSSEKPCQDEYKMDRELTAGTMLSYARHQKSLFFAFFLEIKIFVLQVLYCACSFTIVRNPFVLFFFH